MVLFDFAQFMFNLLIAGFLLRYAQVKLLTKDSDAGKALAFIY